MSNCPSNISFSKTLSKKRIEYASSVLGDSVVNKILAFAMFLLGGKRDDIARHLEIPLGTLLSMLTRIGQKGLPAFEDHRCKASQFLPIDASRKGHLAQLKTDKEKFVINFGIDTHCLVIPANKPLLTKTILLTLLHNNLLERSQVARTLGYSPDHATRLAQRLFEDDINVLLDKRQGQQRDYRITPEIKSELIQQFTADVITRGQTSGKAISKELKERCDLSIPERTVRQHVANMGLPAIKESLPELIASIKKTSAIG